MYLGMVTLLDSQRKEASGLPWRKVSDKNEVLKVKEDCRINRDKLFCGIKCKEEFGKIMEYIDTLHYEDRVDYNFIYELLKTVSSFLPQIPQNSYGWKQTFY